MCSDIEATAYSHEEHGCILSVDTSNWSWGTPGSVTADSDCLCSASVCDYPGTKLSHHWSDDEGCTALPGLETKLTSIDL